MAHDSKNEKTEFSDVKFESHASQERIEDVSHTKEHADEIAELSGIEATAASKAAWLIAITVSIGNLLFGMYRYLGPLVKIDAVEIYLSRRCRV
jgi:SP family myo-inositol transporter-like MFS transporter 13